VVEGTDSATLEGPQAESIRSDCLRGQRVTLTGAMASMRRAEVVSLVRACGGQWSPSVTHDTTLLVVGERGWPLKRNGRLTNKLRRSQALREKGYSIEVLGEEAFLERVGLHARADAVCRQYSQVELLRILGISRSQLQSLLKAGLVQPVASRGGLLYFDFRQASQVRSILRLVAAGVPVRDIRRSLMTLRRCLPGLGRSTSSGEAPDPLDWLGRLEVEGKCVVVRSRDGDLLEPSGQMRLDFSERRAESTLRFQTNRFEEAVALEQAGRLKEAVAAYRAILAEEGPDAVVNFNLANALFAQGEYAAAAERFRVATEIDPEFAEAWNNLGHLLADQGQLDEATTAYRAALRANPTYADAQYGLADVLDEAGRVEEARAQWRAYLALESVGDHADYARQRLSLTG